MSVPIPKAYRVSSYPVVTDYGIFYARNPSAAKYKAFKELLSEFVDYEDVYNNLKAIRAPEYDDAPASPEEFDYINSTYSVPAEFGMQVIFDKKEAVILGTHNQYLKLFDGKKEFFVHPTWRMYYLNKNGECIRNPGGYCNPPIVLSGGI